MKYGRCVPRRIKRRRRGVKSVLHLRHIQDERLHVRLLPPQAAEQPAERCLDLYALPLYMLDVENPTVHHVLVTVCKRVRLRSRMENGEDRSEAI
jgi:hypothetical protein